VYYDIYDVYDRAKVHLWYSYYRSLKTRTFVMAPGLSRSHSAAVRGTLATANGHLWATCPRYPRPASHAHSSGKRNSDSISTLRVAERCSDRDTKTIPTVLDEISVSDPDLVVQIEGSSEGSRKADTSQAINTGHY
jgi:hypothetical protein